MGYHTGSAADITAVRDALVTACVADGWSWDAGSAVLSRGTVFVVLQVSGGYLTLLGRTAAGSGNAPTVVRIGQIGARPLTFPLTYHAFVFDDEVYLVVRYSIDWFQWMTFGKSTLSGLPGTGTFVGATGGATAGASVELFITPTSGGTVGLDNGTSGALFWATVAITPSAENCYVHHDLDGRGWQLTDPAGSYMVGIADSVPLIGSQPNVWNSESVLLPIRAWAVRPAAKISLIAELQHARYMRIDNHEPGEVIALGTDQWMVLPWYRKNSSVRNGGSNVTHSGTLGWAIRYEGP